MTRSRTIGSEAVRVETEPERFRDSEEPVEVFVPDEVCSCRLKLCVSVVEALSEDDV